MIKFTLAATALALTMGATSAFAIGDQPSYIHSGSNYSTERGYAMENTDSGWTMSEGRAAYIGGPAYPGMDPDAAMNVQQQDDWQRSGY